MNRRRTVADFFVGVVIAVSLLAGTGALLGVFVGSLAAVAHLVFAWLS